ncbi:MMPL family transporter [Paenibacillus albiflavus]|uniref:MMPL family transporter n=1 Tax=Paenibacillus albiflavus TaxID=2545760 RepID=A0A4R4EEU6_9BACL|nr:MMPL family transporter [Paenibacillus albiflavus]TCZ76588.1 MMPL family transporter [Paenibacillus albiflavus]
MLRGFRKLAEWTSNPKGAKIILAAWLVVIILLSVIAPGSKQYAHNSQEGSIHENTPSATATELMNEYYPSKNGLTALLVFHRPTGITADDEQQINQLSEWLTSDDKPEFVASSLPYHKLPNEVKKSILSEDQTSLLINIAMQKDISSDQNYQALNQITEQFNKLNANGLQFEITGPAGITADTINLFKNADFVLMFATVGLILVMLIVIYRSPLLAIIPLLVAGVVYQIVDRLLGLGAKSEWFVVDNSATSIMMVMLFAVLTDYCLFIVSRYREELRKIGSKHTAMRMTMTHLGEPIAFSGGTVLIAMLTLLACIFKPYNHFAPVFSVAIVVILLAGLTLIPSIFTLLGRKAYWPFVPKLDAQTEAPHRFWSCIGSMVTKKPIVSATVLLVLLVGSALNLFSMNYSFNLMKSFPDNITSRQGFELLEQHYPKGELAPVSVILKSDKELQLNEGFIKQLTLLTNELKRQPGIEEINPAISSDWIANPDKLPKNFISDNKKAIKLQIILSDNPYDQAALNTLQSLRENASSSLAASNLNAVDYSLHYAGQTAEQLDVREMNTRDTILLFSLITVFITIMLLFQTRSLKLALLMILTILLSYAATLGLGWMIYHLMLGYDSISYRLPLYTFVFMVALGVDYNIMLVSRINEEARSYEWKEAIKRGVTYTGGVISSAGLILAATFCVLITQPLQELFLFGLTMAMGIIIDTFLVRGVLLPSIMALMVKKPQHHNQTFKELSS